MYNTKLRFYKALCIIELQDGFIKLWNGNFERIFFVRHELRKFSLIIRLLN